MIQIKNAGLDLFHNGAGKMFVLRLCEMIVDSNILIRVSTTNNLAHDWCGFAPKQEGSVSKKEDYRDWYRPNTGYTYTH